MLLTHALALSAKSCFLRDRVHWYKCAPCKTPTKLLRKVIVVGTRTTYQASGDARTEMPPARLFFMPKCKVEDWPLHFMFVVHLYLTSRFFYIYPLSSMVIAARTKQSNRGSVDHFCNATNCDLSLSTLTNIDVITTLVSRKGIFLAGVPSFITTAVFEYFRKTMLKYFQKCLLSQTCRKQQV